MVSFKKNVDFGEQTIFWRCPHDQIDKVIESDLLWREMMVQWKMTNLVLSTWGKFRKPNIFW